MLNENDEEREELEELEEVEEEKDAGAAEYDTEEPQDQDECVETTFWDDAKTTATATIGLVMLLVGLLLGYLVYPSVQPAIASRFGHEPTPTMVAQQQQPSPEELAQQQAKQQAALEEVMNLLISETNHFRGDESAPVTMIEFADFQ